MQPTHTVDSSQLLASMTCVSVEEDYGPKYSVLSMLELLTVLSSVTEHCRQKEVSNMLTMQTKKQRTNTTMQTRYTYLDYCVHGHGRLQSWTSPWIRAHHDGNKRIIVDFVFIMMEMRRWRSPACQIPVPLQHTLTRSSHLAMSWCYWCKMSDSGISIVDKGLDVVGIVFWYLPTV